MKSLYILAVILGLCTLPINSQNPCPAGRVCPVNIPVRSNVGNAAGTCDGGDSIRYVIHYTCTYQILDVFDCDLQVFSLIHRYTIDLMYYCMFSIAQ